MCIESTKTLSGVLFGKDVKADFLNKKKIKYVFRGGKQRKAGSNWSQIWRFLDDESESRKFI